MACLLLSLTTVLVIAINFLFISYIWAPKHKAKGPSDLQKEMVMIDLRKHGDATGWGKTLYLDFFSTFSKDWADYELWSNRSDTGRVILSKFLYFPECHLP